MDLSELPNEFLCYLIHARGFICSDNEHIALPSKAPDIADLIAEATTRGFVVRKDQDGYVFGIVPDDTDHDALRRI